jgi:RNA polymerase sporulation-specific sigma factor
MTDISIGGPGGGTQRRLLEAAQQGDRTAIEELLRRYERLVWRVVWSLRPPAGCERQDLAQEARIGLLAAVRAWRPQRGPFPAFADRCVRNQALLAVKAAARHKHQLLSHAVSLDHAADAFTDALTGDPFGLGLLDTLATGDRDNDPEARLLAREQVAGLLRALLTLTPSERLALAGTLSGESYERLARARGCTPKAASQAAYRARRKLAAGLPRAT